MARAWRTRSISSIILIVPYIMYYDLGCPQLDIYIRPFLWGKKLEPRASAFLLVVPKVEALLGHGDLFGGTHSRLSCAGTHSVLAQALIRPSRSA